MVISTTLLKKGNIKMSSKTTSNKFKLLYDKILVKVRCVDDKRYTIDLVDTAIDDGINFIKRLGDIYGNEIAKEYFSTYSHKSMIDITIPDKPEKIYALARDKVELFYDFDGTSDKEVLAYLMKKSFGPLIFIVYFNPYVVLKFLPNTVQILREFIQREYSIINKALVLNKFVSNEKLDLYELDHNILEGILRNNTNIHTLHDFEPEINNVDKNTELLCKSNNISLPNFIYRVKYENISKSDAIQIGKQELEKFGLDYFKDNKSNSKKLINVLIHEEIKKSIEK